jgi:plasmid stabilization system protein ParE
MRSVRFAPQAIADLEAIKGYIECELCNPQAAADLIALVFDKIRTLVAMPQLGTRLKTDIPALKAYRFIPCRNCLVFYRIDERNISVIRILYAGRDYQGLLGTPGAKSFDEG